MMKIQICRHIFLMSLTIMKKILDLGEFKLGKNSDEFKYFKKQVMDFFYTELTKLFQIFVSFGVAQRCKCKARLRQGYKDCPKCGGSGYCNMEHENA